MASVQKVGCRYWGAGEQNQGSYGKTRRKSLGWLVGSHLQEVWCVQGSVWGSRTLVLELLAIIKVEGSRTGGNLVLRLGPRILNMELRGSEVWWF